MNASEEMHTSPSLTKKPSLTIAVNVNGNQIGGGLGRAHTMAIAKIEDSQIVSWEEYEVNWDTLHDQGEHGSHHARIVRFLREHNVQAVIAGHAGPPMLHTLEKMHVAPILISGSAQETAQMIAHNFAEGMGLLR